MVLLAASLLIAQQVNPTSLRFEAVPPNTSPSENISFKNTGLMPLSVSVSVDNPAFVIAENRCMNGVKPGTHCNVSFTYAAQFVGELDMGSVSFDYGQGMTTVPLTGNGVSSIATWSKLGPGPLGCLKVHLGNPVSPYGRVGVLDKYYALPTGEPVHFSCTNGKATADLGDVALQYCSRCPGPKHDYAQASFTPDQQGFWTCTMAYGGDGVLGPTSSEIVYQITKPGPPRKCCCGGEPPPLRSEIGQCSALNATK